MVAPTRTPQARGRKCDLCKKILSSATWLDQTKLAKGVEEAQNVLRMIDQHNISTCPCIPKNIENLLTGSTHFEIHRLIAKNLDANVETKQYEYFISSKQKAQSSNETGSILNDCQERKESRFKIYPGYAQHVDMSKQQLKHLCLTIDYWRSAMEDQTHPFDSKLALRLGVTHHVIYACYLFKYHKILDYQLITANLLLNVFRTIEGVTTNAILHAYFLVTKSLIDCDQLQLARQYLRQAFKLNNYQDKSNYESILIDCVACELNFKEGHRDGAHSFLDDLSNLVYIRADDKLQHYYARVMAMSIIVRFIHYYPSKSDNCYEFFHAFRYICAMIRRCYESSFELLLQKASNRTPSASSKQTNILDHSWIRFAICDFVYESFDLLSDFYHRAGLPECLELIFNGLNLISYRNGSVYWQSRILSIGARMDLLCDKFADAHTKLETISRIAGHTDNSILMNVIRLNSEVGTLAKISQQRSTISKEVIEGLLDRIRSCKALVLDQVHRLDLYDVKSGSFSRVASVGGSEALSNCTICIGGYWGKMSLSALRIGIVSSLRASNYSDVNLAIKFVSKLRSQLEANNYQYLEFNDCHAIVEMLLYFTNFENSELLLIDTLPTSHLFMEVGDDKLDIQSQLSSLTLQDGEASRNAEKCNGSKKTTAARKSKKESKIPTSRRSKRKGTYEVAILTEKNSNLKVYNVLETLTDFEKLTHEEIVASYLRNSEPNPDYDLYRRAHELMLVFRLSDEQYDQESILYHMTESIATNTMRYRWMMCEEQTTSPFDRQIQQKTVPNSINVNLPSSIKHLGFCNTLINPGNTVRLMTRTIPEDVRLIQLKYVLDKRTESEHLLCACISSGNQEQIYLHSRRSLMSDDFFDDATILARNGRDTKSLTIASRLAAKIDESRNSLLMKSNSKTTRSEIRQQIETEIGRILYDFENDWLKSFRFVLCGKICDPSYNSLIQSLIADVQTIMAKGKRLCRSVPALRMVLENAPILSRDEFCRVIGILFDCDSFAEEPREFFNKWLKSIENHMTEQNVVTDKTTYLRQLPRNQVGLILDNNLEMIPLESLPVVQVSGQGIFRVPSLRLFSILSTRRCSPIRVDSNEVVYVLDPARNLAKTRERFDHKLTGQAKWCGSIGRPPKTEELENWLSRKQLYIFIGHGAGMAYYNKMCKGRGLSAMPHVECASIVMGCSSGRMLSEGPRLETFGVGWMFVFKGSPCYMGLLWDVTDCDIDKFLDALLDKWLPANRRYASCSLDQQVQNTPITDASTRVRNVCQLKLLVGSAPVVYGLPIWCRES